jgi:hypothetical protein
MSEFNKHLLAVVLAFLFMGGISLAVYSYYNRPACTLLIGTPNCMYHRSSN